MVVRRMGSTWQVLAQIVEGLDGLDEMESDNDRHKFDVSDVSTAIAQGGPRGARPPIGPHLNSDPNKKRGRYSAYSPGFPPERPKIGEEEEMEEAPTPIDQVNRELGSAQSIGRSNPRQQAPQSSFSQAQKELDSAQSIRSKREAKHDAARPGWKDLLDLD